MTNDMNMMEKYMIDGSSTMNQLNVSIPNSFNNTNIIVK